ncbi:DUF6884 domain-containing protein [Marinococcus halophilus]|uniref:DUF6884 domain-containing protein n=1 Tax=Marinococcus halophilus TaxID=1371 RepID=UPI00117D46F6|nr:DUF6884 domain-containing protein [Marinococcus halophilus]
MKQLAIIPCGAKKAWDADPGLGPLPVKHVYQSTFHQLCRAYAEAFTDQWTVLSGKHGFMYPQERIDANYDVTFGKKQREEVSTEFCLQQWQTKQMGEYDQYVVLLGRKFNPLIARILPMERTVFPLRDYRGMGYMQQALKQAVGNNRPLPGHAQEQL